ncbi:FAM86 N-terminal domain-containing protein [Plasmodiophora brassicae]
MLFAARLDGLHTRLLSKRIADTDNDGAVLDDIDELISDAVASSSVERIDTLSKVCLPFLTALLSFAIDDPSKGEHLDRISSLVSRLSSSQGRSRTRSWSYSFGNVELHDADICDADLGSQTWESGVILARLIDEATVPVGGRVVLELGSGTGLAGIVASKRNARRIVMTDYHDGVIANIRHNLSLNGLTITDAVDVVAVDWRCPPALPDDFTVIVAADFCYDREAAGLVWACVAKYLSATDEGARFHAVVPFRPGFADEVAAFEALAPVNGFVLESSADVDAERMRHRYYVYKRGGKD